MLHQAPSYGAAFPAHGDWIMDSGATSHVTGNQGTLTTFHSPLERQSQHIIVGNGSRLPVVATGSAQLTSHPFHLHNVLVSPNLVSSLISTRSFARDNSCSVEFDPFGFSVKDLATKIPLMRSNSSGDLYPFFGDHGGASTVALSVSTDLWHRRLGHPSIGTMQHVPLDFLSTCTPNKNTTPLCDACQLGKHTKLPFSLSHSRTTKPFDLIHCDLWTSPVIS
jgi:histone deacetylase 1/2